MKNFRLYLSPYSSVIYLILFVFSIFFILNKEVPQPIVDDTTTIDLVNGFTLIKTKSTFEQNKVQTLATFFKMEKIPSCKIKFVSRKNFKEDFNFENIEKQCELKNEQIVLQVASAFTPDWKVIEGFALQDGKIVGEDSYLGENQKLSYQGILLIKNGKPFITCLNKILDRNKFTTDAIRDECSMFQQFPAIIDGKINSAIELPGIHIRRFFVEIMEDNQSKFGIIDFKIAMSYTDAVRALKHLELNNIKIHNALYLDMGAVSEGYIYNSKGQRHLIGDPHKNINNYTNVLVMYKDLKID